MTTNFSLSKEMRTKVADELTIKAVEKHGARIGKKLVKINDEFWQRHLAKVAQILTLEPARYPELIQAGLLTATTSCTPEGPGRKGLIKFAMTDRSSGAEELAVFKLVLRSQPFSQVADFIKAERYYETHYRLVFVSKAGSVPMLREMEQIDEQNKLLKAAEAIRIEMAEVMKAAVEFRSKTMDILNSVRSSRQLTDLFPEAANLLPPPVKTRTEVAPTELVDSVRSMLNKGIPPVAA